MATGDRENLTYEFGPFRLDPAERLLLREGQPVALTPKAFDLLVYLVEHHHRLAEKQALMSASWPDTVVEETNLAYTVSALRKALADGRDDGTFIETVPTRGYRFVAPVVQAPSVMNGASSRRRRVWLMTGALVLVGATDAAVLLLMPLLRSRAASEGATALQPEFRRLTANPSEIPVQSAAISPDGRRSRVLWTPQERTVVGAIPSRDGKHLAIEATTTTGNVWMMTGYQ